MFSNVILQAIDEKKRQLDHKSANERTKGVISSGQDTKCNKSRCHYALSTSRRWRMPVSHHRGGLVDRLAAPSVKNVQESDFGEAWAVSVGS